MEYFDARFKSQNNHGVRIQGGDLQWLTVEESDLMELPFTEEEIKVAVFERDGDKCPGPDGFNLAFLEKC